MTTKPKTAANAIWVWAETRDVLAAFQSRLQALAGSRRVTRQEAVHAALVLAASASDEDLRRGEL